MCHIADKSLFLDVQPMGVFRMTASALASGVSIPFTLTMPISQAGRGAFNTADIGSPW
jgi:hypothetical protein